ncbi:MAG: 4Fe-4S ferredoxin, partial [Acidobacteria bacterium]
APLVSALFAAATAAVLVMDLERPERFLFILTRPNWNSWMARGAFLLTAHGALAGLWLLSGLAGWHSLITLFAILTLPVALATTAYTGFLFAQGLARDLWQGTHGTMDLVAQAMVEGAAALLIASLFAGHSPDAIRFLAWTLGIATAVHFLILVFEHLFTPSATLNHELAVRAIVNGAYRKLFWYGALGLGGVAPLVLIAFTGSLGFPPAALALTALVALAGGLAWEYIWVEAGQSVPNS